MQTREGKKEQNRDISRRSFILGSGTAAILSRTGIPALAFAAGQTEGPEVKMILRRDRPLNLEAPRAALNSWLTPTGHFYVRNHYQNPEVDFREWRIAIGGEVSRTLQLDMAALMQLPKTTLICPLECTGNGRAYFKPQTRGNQWEMGAVGNAVWGGVRLKDILGKTDIRSAGKYITFKGGEKRPAETAPRFIRSVPLAKAMRDIILAYEMNGQPLTPDHGFPVRAIVPGWYGASSVKWLNAIDVTQAPDPGHYQEKSYRLILKGQEIGQAEFANVMKVKSVITHPSSDPLSAGMVGVQGVAWTGKGKISRVEISADAGKTWTDTRLTGPELPYAWQSWFYAWEAKPGTYSLMSRATDSAGRIQPMNSVWNKKGYANNAVADHALQIHVS